MKKMKWLLLCVVIFVFFSGCAAEKKQAVAVEQMLASYGGYCMVAEGVEKQMASQAKNVDKNASGAIYTISTDLPDFSYFSADDLKMNMPKMNWNNLDLSDIDASVEKAMKYAVVEYLRANKATKYISVPLEVIVKKDDGQWTAELTRHGEEWLDNEIGIMLSALCADSEAVQDIYGIVEIAEEREILMELVFDKPEFAVLAVLTSIIPDGNGEYKIEIDYPDPEGVYAKLQEEAVLGYSAPIFEDVSVLLTPLDAGEYAAGAKLSGSFVVVGSAGMGFGVKDEDIGKFKINDVCLAHEAAASLSINESWRVRAEGNPGSGVLYGSSSGNKCIVNTSADSGDYYLRFYAISGDDLDEDGELALGVYISAGKQYSFNMPSGNYKLIFGNGGDWYGVQYMFGPQGGYRQMDSVIESKDGYYNELTLYSVAGGNTGISDVPFYLD